jgi:hypothetical protein
VDRPLLGDGPARTKAGEEALTDKPEPKYTYEECVAVGRAATDGRSQEAVDRIIDCGLSFEMRFATWDGRMPIDRESSDGIEGFPFEVWRRSAAGPGYVFVGAFAELDPAITYATRAVRAEDKPRVYEYKGPAFGRPHFRQVRFMLTEHSEWKSKKLRSDRYG